MVYQVLQLIGATLVFVAYWLVQKGTLKPEQLSYCVLNFLGAFTLTIIAFTGRQWGFFGLNALWTVIAISGLLRVRRARIG